MRKGAIAAGLVLHLGLAAPASAKAPAMTWEVLPEQPAAGAPVTLVMRSWSWGTDGPDLSRPWDFWPGDRVRPGIRAALLGTDRTAPVPVFDRMGTATYRTTIRFPRPGRWALGWKGGEPYAEGEDPFGFPVIDVRPAEGGTAMRKTAAAIQADGLPALRIAAGVAIVGAGLGFGLGRRRRR